MSFTPCTLHQRSLTNASVSFPPQAYDADLRDSTTLLVARAQESNDANLQREAITQTINGTVVAGVLGGLTLIAMMLKFAFFRTGPQVPDVEALQVVAVRSAFRTFVSCLLSFFTFDLCKLDTTVNLTTKSSEEHELDSTSEANAAASVRVPPQLSSPENAIDPTCPPQPPTIPTRNENAAPMPPGPMEVPLLPATRAVISAGDETDTLPSEANPSQQPPLHNTGVSPGSPPQPITAPIAPSNDQEDDAATVAFSDTGSVLDKFYSADLEPNITAIVLSDTSSEIADVDYENTTAIASDDARSVLSELSPVDDTVSVVSEMPALSTVSMQSIKDILKELEDTRKPGEKALAWLDAQQVEMPRLKRYGSRWSK